MYWNSKPKGYLYMGIKLYKKYKKNNNILIALICFLLGYIVAIHRKRKKINEFLLKKSKELDTVKSNYQFLNTCIHQYAEGVLFDSFLTWYGAKTIAVYGYGYVGKFFIKTIKNSDIQVKYIIDKNADFIISDIPVITVNDEFPAVDVIVVTVMNEFASIESKLRKKCTSQILSIEDIIYGNEE